MSRRVNLLLPLAGRGQRFIDRGYATPKPLVRVGDRPIIEWALDSIVLDHCRPIFVVRAEHVRASGIDRLLRQAFGDDIEVVVAHHETAGTVSSCLLARDLIDDDTPLVVFTPDVCFAPAFDPASVPAGVDGMLLTFRASSPAYSYAEVDAGGWVRRTAEKRVISPHAAVGVYHFGTGHAFVDAADEMVARDLRTNGEFYVCPLYNLLVERCGRVAAREVERMHVLGTPEEVELFVQQLPGAPMAGDRPPAGG